MTEPCPALGPHLVAQPLATSFPRKRESMLMLREVKMDSRFRGNDGHRGPLPLLAGGGREGGAQACRKPAYPSPTLPCKQGREQKPGHRGLLPLLAGGGWEGGAP